MTGQLLPSLAEPDAAPASLLSEDDWASLAATVSCGRCTLMLGPGTVTGCLDGDRMPAHVALATHVRKHLSEQLDPRQLATLDPQRPSAVAQVALAREDPVTISRWIDEFYRVFEVEGQMLEDLAALPFPLVLNTSPGPTVHDAFAAAKPQTCTEYYDLRGPAGKRLMPEPTPQAPVVYHLYGVFEQPQSVVLSDSDRLDFVVAVASNNPPLPRNLLSHMQDPDRTFLFVGFDLADWQFRILLHVLARSVSRRYKSFAFELDANPLDPATQEFYLHSQKIHFFRGELPRFTSELRRRVLDLVGETPGAVAAPADSPAPDAPVVFLCYARDDAPRVEHIANGLRQNGLRTWRDVDSLRGGDRWDSMIRSTLRNDVDYVVVAESQSLVRKAAERSYVNREIKIALDVQDEYALPRVFLIPVLLDGPDNQRDELSRFQGIDLAQDGAVDMLARAIKRDMAERRLR